MDVVIPYIKSSSQELLWAIKSLKNLEHDNVYVIGDKNDSSAIHIQPEDNFWSKMNAYHNQIYKYLVACNTPEISETFIASNDDIFIMRKWAPVNYNRGELSHHISGRRINDIYTRSLTNTLKYLESRNLPTLSFELHTPFVYEKQKLKELILSLDLSNNRPFQLRSLYGNIYNVETEYRSDTKNMSDFKDSDIISTNEKTFRSNIGIHIRSVL